ncbi:MAG TPA: SGNH/GDSL hydrolase family protein [Chroococcidiopsis sp.]
MKLALIVVLVLSGLGLLVEVGLRLLFGFGNPLLYAADPQIGYLLAPNQDVRRFGNRIVINQYSMRGDALSPTRPTAMLRVLMLGDSIANGGWWTDQEAIISALLRRQLQTAIAPLSYDTVEVLNASANSWSPRNELAYLKRYGAFESQVIVLLINTDDLFGTAPTSVQVGRDRNYPDRKPPLAIVELLTRYVFKAGPIPEMEAVLAEGGDRVGINLETIGAIQTFAKDHNAQLLLVMTPLLREVGDPGPKDYEIKARQRLTDFTEAAQIPYIDILPIFNAMPDGRSLYRDHIHLSPSGNQIVSSTILDRLKTML